MESLKNINLTNDPLANIHIMAPLLSKESQAAVYGLICGLIASEKEKNEGCKS